MASCMFELVERAVATCFGGGEAAGQTSSAALDPAPVLASGTPDVAASLDVFGGLFDDHQDLKEYSRKCREAAQLSLAKDRLAEKFQVSEDASGDLNEVTPEQFEAIAKLYTDIEHGRTDIKFDLKEFGEDAGRAREQKALAMEDMARLLQTPSGRQLLSDMANNTGADGEHRQTTLRLTDNQFDDNEADASGTGAYVQYHPGRENQLGALGIPTRGDISLAHELIHAHHITHGTRIDPNVNVGDDAVTEGDRDERMEEYATVGLGKYRDDFLTENNYRLERRCLGEDVEDRFQYT